MHLRHPTTESHKDFYSRLVLLHSIELPKYTWHEHNIHFLFLSKDLLRRVENAIFEWFGWTEIL